VYLVAATALFTGPLSRAHRILVFAAAEDRTISGYVYLSGGNRLHNVTVTVTTPEGRKLGQVTSDENGEFVFQATARCNHVFRARTADGHAAEWTIPGADLPDDLPDAAAAADTRVQPMTTDTVAAVNPLPLHANTEQHGNNDHLERMVSLAVARQIRPLREQLARYEQKTRFHDVLGGIGYILGVTGIGFYVLGRKQQRRREERTVSSS